MELAALKAPLNKVCFASSRYSSSGEPSCPVQGGTVVFLSSTILFGLMFMFFLVFGLLVGACCMLGIQTPLRFPSRKLAVNKEF